MSDKVQGQSRRDHHGGVRQDSFRYEPYLHVRIALAWAVEHGWLARLMATT